MINYDSNYTYLIVPNEYKCVYYNILNVLGSLGEDLLSSCTATCKGRAINGIACYNMFNAACACYYLGQIKRARVLISYIKAQLDISCDNLVIFEDSSNDEFVYLKVPVQYEDVFETLLTKMASWGQELLDDCTTSCKGENKNILNAWNLFQGAMLAFEYGNSSQANKIVNYITNILNIGSDSGGEDSQDQKKYFTINVGPVLPSNAIVTINGISTRSLTVEENTTVNIVVTAAGYQTYTYSFIAKDNMNIPVTLNVIPVDPDEPVSSNVIITIIADPSDANVTINGNNVNTLSVPIGTMVSYRVYKNGYQDATDTFVASESVELRVKLISNIPSPEYATIGVIPTPSDATVRINGSIRTSARLQVGTSCTIQVSKTGYITKSKTFVVEGDYTWTPNLQQSLFEFSPTNINLPYTGGNAYFEGRDPGQPETGIVMLNNANNPSALQYYDWVTNQLIAGATVIGVGITNTDRFYTIVPENNTAYEQTYNIIARNNSGASGYQDIPITIKVAANPNAGGNGIIVVDGAIDVSTRNYISGASYENTMQIGQLNPTPSNNQSYTDEFELNPDSTEGWTLIVSKSGYKAYVNNINYSEGSKNIVPTLMELPDDEDYLYVTPVRYTNSWNSEQELFRNLQSNGNPVDENDFELDAVPYEDGMNQSWVAGVMLIVQCSAGQLTGIIHDKGSDAQGIEIYTSQGYNSNYTVVELFIDVETWKNQTITFTIDDSQYDGTPRHVTVNVLDPDSISNDIVIIKSAKDNNDEFLEDCSYEDNKNQIAQQDWPQNSEQFCSLVFEHNSDSNKGDTVIVSKDNYKTFIKNVDYRNGSKTIQPILSPLGNGKYLYITPIKYTNDNDYVNLFSEVNTGTPIEENDMELNMVPFIKGGIKQCVLKLYVESNDDINVSVNTPNQSTDGITISNDTALVSNVIKGYVLITIDYNTWKNSLMTVSIEGDTEMSREIDLRILNG